MANEKSDALDDLTIRKMEQPEKKKWVRDGKGLALCLTPGKSANWRNWYFIYTSPETGEKIYKGLGAYPAVSLAAARKAATLLRADLLKGVDPKADERREAAAKVRADEEARRQQEEEARALTVSGLIDEYLEKHAKPNKRGWLEDKRILEHDALKVWGTRRAEDISKRDVVLLLERIIERGSPGSANNNFKIIRKMFNYAVEKDILKISPCIGVKMPAPLVTKDRALSEQEIKTFWDSLDTCHVSDEIKRALRLILVTGQRPGEVIGMHSSELDGHWWTIPAERSKNKRAHRVYLTETALELIGQTEGIGYIFPSPRSAEATKHKILKPIEVNAIAHVIRRNSAVSVLVNGEQTFDKSGKPITENKLGVDDFTPHDLRRTAATCMSQLGFMDEVIDAVLNHTKQGIIRTYNVNRYDREKQQALEAWERKLLSTIHGTTAGKVIPINRTANE